MHNIQGCANFANIIFRKIGRQKQRAKCWHNEQIVSSAKRKGMECLNDDGISLMILNNSGPRMLPCGTPESTAQ